MQGNDKEINEHLALLKDKFNGLTGSDYHTKSIQYSSKGLLDHLQKADDDVDDLNKKLASAEAIAANDYDANQKPKTANVKKDEAKKVADLKDKVKEAEEHAKKARESLVAFAKANQNKLGLKDNFLLAATQGAAVNKSGPSVVLQEKNAEPAEKVDFAALRKTSEGVTADASKVGLDASPVQAQGEDPAKFQARVTEARKKLDGLSRDDFRKIFLVKDPKAQNGHVAPEVIRLKGYDLRVPELYDAFMDRVQNDVPELFDASAAAANSTDVVFTGGTVELDGVKTSPESPLPGVHFATPKGAKAKDPKDPYGTYIVAEDSDLYQESIGSEDNPVDTFVVENSKFHAEGVVRASKVSIKDSEVAGYNKTANKETALQVVAAAYKDTAIRGNSTQSAAGPVIARKRTIANFEGLKNSNLNVEGFQDVTITSSNLKSDGLGVNAAAENMTIKDSVINMASIPTGPVQIVAQNLVVEGKSVISHKEAIPGGSVDTLTTIRGANLKKTFIETTTGKNGQQTTKEVEEDAVDTFKVGMGSQVWANVEDFEEGTVAGTLMSDRIGSKDPKDPKQDKLINKLVLEQGADLRKYSKTGNTIYGSEKLDLTVGNGTTVIHDVDGFHSIVLDGGLLEGNLTGSPVPKPFSGDNAFDGSTVEMKSGTYQGGNVEDVKSFTISGPVHLMPGSSKLGKVDAGKVEETDVKPVVIKGKVKVKVDVKSGVVFDIAKSNLDKSQSPVQVEGDVTFEKGSGLAAVVDFNSGKADPTVAYMNIAGSSGVLKLKGGNRVYLRPDKLNNEQTYKVSKDLYDEYKKDPTGSYDLKVVEYQSMDGKFEAPVSEYPLINVAPVPAVTPLGSPGSYQIKLRFNPDPRSAFRSVFNMSSNDAEVASAALLSSLEAGGDAGKEMFGAIQKVGYQKIASENQWDPHVGMGMAAVTVTQKANQSISRHLNRHRTGIATGDMFESKGVWGEYFYSDGEMDDKRDVRGFKNKVNGINLGLDALLNDQLTVGFAFTYGDVKTETNKSGRDASGDTYMGTLYTGWTMENYFFDTMWSYGRGDIDMKRKTSQGTYKSDTKSDTLGARLVGGYNYQFNQWLIQPQIEFNYVKVKFDDFKEKQDQGPLPQSVKLDDFEVMELGAGLKLMADYDVANGMLKPEFTLMGYHDFKDKKPEVQGTFLNGGRTYHVSGRDREQNRVLAGVGVKYEMNNNLTLGLNYDYNWQGDYTAHGIVGSVRYDF
ncbi:autotransporter outer membrane beta-barrel domain-containing protein [Endozoicomonas gorgoniicola]|uniref:Autotransporter outer membrane beta-barrel domain-containing protein n=1 Tax=Endozoicomonas gorgoniicola TaxID=1234144 RepID=A0ABT3MVF7_9GAMM|nr:autotransporter outer membrane beta-barrel domain-containing protein [Endozoicomonas gorgoniicola]MCW7553343.1 autotransporter outer membrane beta-barrel domain-containing protein [Endozoicomonas gorgoniicola]